MRKKLGIKKVTLRDLDTHTASRIVGGATDENSGCNSCWGNTCPLTGDTCNCTGTQQAGCGGGGSQFFSCQNTCNPCC